MFKKLLKRFSGSRKEPEVVLVKEVVKPKPVAGEITFKDFDSYFKDLAFSGPTTDQTAIVKVIQALAELRDKHKTPVRISCSAKDNSSNFVTQLDFYQNNRWYSSKTYNIEERDITSIIGEFVQFLADEGWGCVEHAVDQFFQFIEISQYHNGQYLNTREGNVKTTIVMVLSSDTGNNTDSSFKTKIAASVSLQLKNKRPLSTMYVINFDDISDIKQTLQA